MAKKQPKTEADFTVSISHDDMAKFGNPTTVKFTEDTGNMAWGDYTFKITVDNMLNLETLCKYAQMLDFVTHAKGENELNIDGVVNDILDEALSRNSPKSTASQMHMISRNRSTDARTARKWRM